MNQGNPLMLQYSIFLVLAVVTALVIIPITVNAWLRFRTSEGRILIGYLISGCWLLIAATMELLTVSEGFTYFFAVAQYLSFVSLPVLWFKFAVTYTGRGLFKNRMFAVLVWIVPVISFIMVATNSYHGLHWSSFRFEKAGHFLVMKTVFGRWFWVHFVYSYTLFFAGAFLIGFNYFFKKSKFSKQSIWVTGGSVIPLVFNLAYVFRVFPGMDTDFTPVSLLLAGFAFSVGINRYGLFDLMPVAQHIIVSTIPDPVVVIDRKDRIIDANPAAIRVFSITGDPGGQSPAAYTDLSDIVSKKLHSELVPVITPDGERWFDIREESADSVRNSARVIVFRDVTDRKRMSDEQQTLISKLQDAADEIKKLRGIIPICANCKNIRDDEGYWHQVESYLSSNAGVEFTHGICPQCRKKLYPDISE